MTLALVLAKRISDSDGAVAFAVSKDGGALMATQDNRMLSMVGQCSQLDLNVPAKPYETGKWYVQHNAAISDLVAPRRSNFLRLAWRGSPRRSIGPKA